MRVLYSTPSLLAPMITLAGELGNPPVGTRVKCMPCNIGACLRYTMFRSLTLMSGNCSELSKISCDKLSRTRTAAEDGIGTATGVPVTDADKDESKPDCIKVSCGDGVEEWSVISTEEGKAIGAATQ